MNENSEISEMAQSAQSVTNTVVTPQSYVMTYTYDANNRMLTQKKAENGIDYLTKMGYDKNGNMTSRQRSSIGGPVGDNTNIEVSIGTMQSNPGSESVAETFSYNSLNQMVGYQNSNGTSASYTYDATGMRTSKTVNGVEKKFYYNGMYILNEGDGAEITATNFVGLTGIEGRKNGANEMAFFMKDAHGDVVKAMDSEDFRADYEYDIWGNQTQEATNTFDNPFRYCSEYMDDESGLIYLRARYYDSNTGRFTQEDPAKDGLNWYIYCKNDPVTFIDFTGCAETRPMYSSELWKSAIDATNCYAYAMNWRVGVWYGLSQRSFTSFKPGLNPGELWNPSRTGQRVEDYLFSYDPETGYRQINPNLLISNCRNDADRNGHVFTEWYGDPWEIYKNDELKNNWLVAVYISKQKADYIDENGVRQIYAPDYHFLRQDADGTWSHKLGAGGPVTNRDADGNVIWSPAANLYYCTYDPEQNAYIHLNYKYVGTYLVGPAN